MKSIKIIREINMKCAKCGGIEFRRNYFEGKWVCVRCGNTKVEKTLNDF